MSASGRSDYTCSLCNGTKSQNQNVIGERKKQLEYLPTIAVGAWLMVDLPLVACDLG